MKYLKYFLLFLVIFSCNQQQPISTADIVLPTDTTISPTQLAPVRMDMDSLLLDYTREILTVIKSKDYVAFSAFIHPQDGIRFSPYAYISKEHLKLSKNEFLLSLKQRDLELWGEYAGSGDSIYFRIQNYFKRFVYDVDFLNAEKITANSSNVSGNSINNQKEFYTNVNYTECYFSGFDKKYAGMDWRALRLIFKEYNGKDFLVGIVRDEWTP